MVSADPVELDRVNIYEEWESEADLATFRGSGPDSGISSLIIDAKVAEHRIAADDLQHVGAKGGLQDQD